MRRPTKILTALFGLLLMSQVAGATTYYVTLPDDGPWPDNTQANAGTLRWCLLEANQNPGFDTIIFQPMSIIMIVPESTYEITDSVAIYENTSILIAPDGGFAGESIFEIGDGKTAVEVLMQGFDLLGYNDTFAPRAIDVLADSHLSFTYARVTEFQASAVLGTIRLRRGSSAVIEQSSFTNNAMFHGGGVFNDGADLEIVSSTFRDNSAVHQGGAVYSTAGSTATVTASQLLSNTAGARGGALHFRGDSLFVGSSTFQGNGAGTAGGGLYLAVGSTAQAIVSASAFSNIIAVVRERLDLGVQPRVRRSGKSRQWRPWT